MLKNVWWARKAFYSFSFLPLELLSYLGVTLTLASLIAGGWLAVDCVRRPESGHGVATIIVLILFFGSLNLLAISLLGEYLIKISEESKRRPKFIRRAIWRGGTGVSRPSELAALIGQRKAARRSMETGGG